MTLLVAASGAESPCGATGRAENCPMALDDIELVGLDPCLPFFGAVEAEWLVP